jgi:hypothetical protein
MLRKLNLHIVPVSKMSSSREEFERDAWNKCGFDKIKRKPDLQHAWTRGLYDIYNCAKLHSMKGLTQEEQEVVRNVCYNQRPLWRNRDIATYVSEIDKDAKIPQVFERTACVKKVINELDPLTEI